MTAGGDPAAELIQTFREEAAEHLDGIVECLLAVENGRALGDTTNELFRHAHSIKGNAGMVGLDEAGAIAGAIEDVLERAREDGALSPLLTEPLLHATDKLRRTVAGERGVAAAAVEALAAEVSSNELREEPRMTEPREDVPPTTSELPADGYPATSKLPADRQPVTSGVPNGATRRTGVAAEDGARSHPIRVPAHKVDRMLDAVSETALHHRRLEHVLEGPRNADALEREVDRGELLLDELQQAVLDMRMLPLGSITSPLPRAVRDLAVAEGKEVDLEITGAETQLDRVLLDGISEALGHLLRNAIAHGIEPPDARERAGKPRRGRLELHAEPRGGQVAIEVFDDGRGVAADALAEAARRGSLVDVLAEPGFSTAEGVSAVAGRGVGLDAVKRQVESIGGSLAIDTDPGAGTRTTLLLPVTLALLRVLIVQRGGQRYGLPLASVTEAIAVEQMLMLGGRPSIQVREDCLRLFDLALIVGMTAPELPELPRAVVVQTTGGRLAVACDGVAGEQEVVVKPLGSLLAKVPGYLGAAILGDGVVMPILDPAHLARQALRGSAAVRVNAAAAQRAREAPKVLVVDDQFTVRELQRSILRAAGYRVQIACDGREALDAVSAQGDFDIVVTDLQMPEMDGLELLAAIRAHPDRSSLPVVVVTSRGSDEDRRRGVEAGADAYIVKDEFDQRALLETVERLVGSL
jgi:two-component system, chemotaxis family, sensor kinase CheA